MRQQSDPRASGLEALAALTPHLPTGTSLERFAFEVGDKAEISGTITEVLVENGDAIEYGQPLFKVKTA